MSFTSSLFGLAGLIAAAACSSASAQTVLQQPVTIPLALLKVGASERLAIPASIGDSGITGNYLLDTGSSPFVSAYTKGAPWWGSQFSPTGETRVIHYVETGFQFSSVLTRVTVGSGNKSVSSSPDFPVNQAVIRLVKRADAWVEDPRWKEALEAAIKDGVPPEARHFYGTMGADLGNSSVGLFRLVLDATGSQGPLVAGFAIEGLGSHPELTIGLTPEMKNRFPIQIPINKAEGNLAQKVIAAEFSLEYRGQRYPLGRAGVVLDTGAPRTAINTAEGFEVPPTLVAENGLLRRGVALHMRCGDLAWTHVAGPGHQIAVRKAAGPEGGVNSGIRFFHYFNVMFDVQNGIVGFAPVRQP